MFTTRPASSLPRAALCSVVSLRRRSAGLTLIELMIVVAIIAILASVAVPSYRSYVLRSHRADAQAFLSNVVARQQHFLLDRRSYATSLSASTSDNGLAIAVPTSLSASYTITVTTDNTAKPPVFTASAVPTAAQTADPCGTLRINQQGTKSATGTGSCW